jgi:hypothetical protein
MQLVSRGPDEAQIAALERCQVGNAAAVDEGTETENGKGDDRSLDDDSRRDHVGEDAVGVRHDGAPWGRVNGLAEG